MNTEPLQPFVTSEEEFVPHTDDRLYRRLGWIVLGVLIGVFGIWASFAPLSSAVPASGKVIVASKNQIIAHPDGGVIQSILVNEGENVRANQPLLVLESIEQKAQLDMTLAQYYQSLAMEARLIAERDRASVIDFPSELLSMKNTLDKNSIVEGQKREFQTRKRQLSEEKNIYMQRIEQMRNQITGLEAIVQSKSELSRSYKDEIQEWEILYKQQLIDKIRLRDIQREKMKLDAEVANAKSDILRARSQISENNAQILNQQQLFDKEVIAQLNESQTKLADMRARILALKDKLGRTTLRTPLAGVVTNMQSHTLGGVIIAGHPIMEIVPDDQPLIIEGKVAVNEAINVHQGFKAEIRFPSFAHIKALGVVNGEIIYMAPDAVSDEKTQAMFYVIKVKVTHQGKEELRKNHLMLQAGMPADVMVIIKSRTFADYMIEPVKNVAQRAFNEQ